MRRARERPSRTGTSNTRRIRVLAVAAATIAVALAGCESDAVSLRYDPGVGDRYRSRSIFETQVVNDLDGVTTSSDGRIVVDAVEEVVGVDEDEIVIDVIVRRDGASNRSYQTRFDRSDRPTAIDLVQGVAVDALEVDVTSAVTSISSQIPAGRVRVGDTWEINEVVILGSAATPTRVSGTARVAALEVVHGVDLARVESIMTVPLVSAFDTDNGRVTVSGTIEINTSTKHGLDDGVIRDESSDVRGRFDVIVEAPAGVGARPVRGRIDYDLTITLERVDLP